ncbi:M13 family metallopeptidase [soil metagenome]
MNKASYFLLALVAFGACKPSNSNKKSLVDVAGIDSSIKPGDNFFRYVNGKWYDTAEIAADQSGVGSYSFMNIPQKKLLENILDSVSKTENPKGSIEQKIGDFYASGMDTVAINIRGYEPIKPTLQRIDAINSIPTFMKAIAEELKTGNRSVIGFGVRPDNKNSSINIANFSQSGIGLPDRDYFFKTDSATVRIQEAYKNYIIKLFELTGSDNATATKNASIVYGIEKEIATSHKTRVEMRDVNKNYNKVSVGALHKKHPNIGWTTLLTNLDAKTDSMNVSQLAYYDKLNDLLKSTSIDDWKIYLKATSIRSYATILSKPFVDASFEFSKVLSGQATQKPRQQIMTENVDGLLGQALGQLYVKKYFNEDAKKRVLDLVNNLTKSFENRINNLEWMSDSTKQKAKEKLYAITKKIGYPDVWRNYDNVDIERTSYFENVQAANQNEYQYRLAKLNKPVDKTEWGTTPSTVTAYYNPSFNEIVFPAGILQFPYFDFYADDALNYGGIGMVIGHELTHAFDDQGAQFDKDGNVKNWWTKEDLEKFKARTGELTKLYSSFTVLDTVHVKGALTIGENTADNGGVAIAYDAFKMTAQGKDSVKIDGFTPDQRFFLSIARIWRVKTRDEFLRTYVNTNPHSPAMWRVNGPLMNFEPFYKAFDVKAGETNYKSLEQRVRIW